MIWYIENAQRFRSERMRIDALIGGVDWLRPLDWRIDASARINWDADLLIGDEVFPISLRYPNHFPHSPPLVLPRGDVSTWWSSHQWGAGGELCLEIGPDNWQPDVSGAEMLESAQRLLTMEREFEDTQKIPSRHETTLGQRQRMVFSRFLATPEFRTFAASAPKDILYGKANLALHDESLVYHASYFAIADNNTWRDISAPKFLDQECYNVDCILIRRPTGDQLPQTSPVEFRTYLDHLGVGQVPARPLILLLRDDGISAYRIYADSVVTVGVIAPDDIVLRTSLDRAALASRTVAVAGCGSVGSKIAVSLARSGVGRFLLLDDDLLLPENLIRNELDWRDIATHKVDAVGRRIQLVNPEAVVEVRRHRLGGHEASGSLETLIESVSKADLIVDAASNSEAFNYLCAAASAGETPMVWAEVHGGGIGGMIARHRPRIEPSPAMMRLGIENWCGEKGLSTQRAERRYEDRDADVTWIAEDADVSVIAAHAARFALDILAERSPSIFPHSVYFIGLAEGWFYSEPFHTEPVILPLLATTEPPSMLDDVTKAEEMKVVMSIMKRSFGEADPT
ncbi:hypothetical protein G9X68_17115 [Rhizobium sp. WYCCWR 11279]|uniref:ThiF family adenylyltransferase n=1 Tax=Rhizobium changzhiense TaxID=2692317 RepID=UPI001492B2AA|nr:ThiF family adenylyltransferase [Rhizobium changzhiense]NNU48822.1 hypothetical protein [Rhizobium changzhiense]